MVAGIAVHADIQWKALETYLKAMVAAHIAPEMRDGFVFHATELFSGGKKMPRETWPKERRCAILDELVRVPEGFDLPIFWGFVERAKFEARLRKLGSGDLTVAAQAVSFSVCSVSLEYWMKGAAEANEVAMIIAEDKERARSHEGAT